MPKILILPHYHNEEMFADICERGNKCQGEYKFYIFPPDESSNSPLNQESSDFKEILSYLYNKKTKMGYNNDDLLLTFLNGRLHALNHGYSNLFMAGARYNEEFPCTAVVSLKFIEWGILEEKYNYELQKHAFFHLIICGLLGGYTNLEAHMETYGCLMDFNNRLFDFNKKLQKGYYLCSTNEKRCNELLHKEKYGNSILQLCSAFKNSGSSVKSVGHSSSK